jgi:hypothetical protein
MSLRTWLAARFAPKIHRAPSTVQEEARRLGTDPKDREEMRVVREQMAKLSQGD